MRKFAVSALLAGLVLSACVTINVYFPAAEAEQAAKEFIDRVIGEDPQAPQPPQADPQSAVPRGESLLVAVLGFFIADAHAQEADLTIRTPAVLAIQERMTQRFQGTLSAGFDSGALGFGSDGLVVLRDPAKVSLKERSTLQQAVADDNRDRNAVYREIAAANNHPEWEPRIRETFARQWVASARTGWWYQAPGGEWKQK